MTRRLLIAGIIVASFVTGAFAPFIPPAPPTPRPTPFPAPPNSRVSFQYFNATHTELDPQYPGQPGSCPFPVQIAYTGYGIKHILMRPDGTKQTVFVQPTTKVTFTNLENGKSLWTPQVTMVKKTIDTNISRVTTAVSHGVLWRIVVPGEGLVAADVGYYEMVWTFDSTGKLLDMDVVQNGMRDGVTVEKLCQYLD